MEEIINQYASDNNASSSRKLAAALSEHRDIYINHQTVANWLNGSYEPTDEQLGLIIGCYDDWRKSMAVACLTARRDRYAAMVEASQVSASPTDLS